MERYRVSLDFGSNSCLMLMVRAAEDGTLTREKELFEATRLGEGVDAHGRLQPAAIERTLEAARGFLKQIPSDWASGAGIAAATSAVRDAENRETFLAACDEVLGGRPLVLSGEEEAGTTFLGAASDQPPGSTVIAVDVGGGSTELSVGRPGEALLSVSVDVGCVRLGERFDLFEVPDPGRLREAHAAVREVVQPAADRILETIPAGSRVRLVGSGGTFTTYAAYREHMEVYDHERVHGYPGTSGDVNAAVADLFARTRQERALLEGIPEGRAPVLPAGLLIVHETLVALKRREFVVSTRGVRFGLIVRLMQGALAPTWRWGGEAAVR